MRFTKGLPYRVVDVFTEHALEGNALAVFTDASGLDDSTMQRIARELNLAETAFILPASRPDCAARVRIFTPAKEMDFAGHPTIGTAYVMVEEGRVAKEIQQFSLEEKVGSVPVRLERGTRIRIWLTTPTIEYGSTYDPSLCAIVLGLRSVDLIEIAPQRLSAGNPTIFVPVKDRASVDRAWLDLTGMKQLRGGEPELACVLVFTPTPEGAYARMFAPEYGIAEDPATGSATGPLAAYMMRHGLVSSAAGTRFLSEQGTKMGRRSLLHVQINGDGGSQSIEIGGYVTPIAKARMHL
jgi:trans-2,3-dihydro-3-hydroxyanthranilate isomerase